MDLSYLQTQHVRLLRLRHTPEELICTVVRDGEGDGAVGPGQIKVIEPVVPVNSGNNQIGLAPWGMFSPVREFVLELSDIMYESDVAPALAKGYLEQMSKIQTATADQIPNGGNITPIR